MKQKKPLLLAATAAALMVLAGCASKPDSYYTLASAVPAAEAAPSTLGDRKSVV